MQLVSGWKPHHSLHRTGAAKLSWQVDMVASFAGMAVTSVGKVERIVGSVGTAYLYSEAVYLKLARSSKDDQLQLEGE